MVWVVDSDVGADATTRGPLGNQRGAYWPRYLDEIIQDAVGHLFVEDPLIAIALQVQLQRLQFHTDFVRCVGEHQRAVIRLASLGADARELWANDLDAVISPRSGIGKGFKLVNRGGFREIHSSAIPYQVYDVNRRGMPPCQVPQPVHKVLLSNGMPNAVVLLSGGLDSTTTLAVAKQEGFDCYALSVNYGQRHLVELRRAEQIASQFACIEHRTVRLDLRAIGGSALTASSIEVPKNRSDEAMALGVPITYVPARNTILLGMALGYAETVQAFDLFIGANVLDYSGYPDCRPAFLTAFEVLANLATQAAIEGHGKYRIHAPLLQLTKAQIIQLGHSLGVDYSTTLSCYDPDEAGRACGACDSCLLRKRGFAEAGCPDPTPYQ